MVKRKKRLKKGIAALVEQIEVHEEKRERAIDEGKEELAEYYAREIAAKKADKKYKEDKLNRK